MKGLFYILLAYLLGEVLSVLMKGFIPPSVLGMIILFAALQAKAIKSSDVRVPARLLLDNMILFFIPVSAGIVTSYRLISDHFWAILAALLASTIVVIFTVGRLQQRFGRRK